MADLRKQTDMRTIPLHGKIAAGRVALVDDEDYDLVMQYRWHAHQNSQNLIYARAKFHGTRSYMHVLIMGCRGIDHRDHNALNNTRANLRVADQSLNNANKRMQRNNTSGFAGVHPHQGAWAAYIGSRRNKRYLGSFASAEEAARARDAAALEAWGEFANLNFPREG